MVTAKIFCRGISLFTNRTFFRSQYSFCGSLVNRTGVFGSCMSSVTNVEKYYENCVFDMCATGGDETVLADVRFSLLPLFWPKKHV